MGRLSMVSMNGSASAERAASPKLSASVRSGVCGRLRATPLRRFDLIGVAIYDFAAIDSQRPVSFNQDAFSGWRIILIGLAGSNTKTGTQKIRRWKGTICNNPCFKLP